MRWLTVLISPVTQWLKNRGEVKAAKHKRELAIIDNQARLAISEQSHNANWEMESLRGNSQVLRLICFIQLAVPITITCITPEHGAAIFSNLERVPDWFVQLYMIVVGAVWGIHEFKQAAPSVIGAVLGGKRQ